MNRTTTKKIINYDVRNKNKQSQEHSIQIIFKEQLLLTNAGTLMLPVQVFLIHVRTHTKLADIFTNSLSMHMH